MQRLSLSILLLLSALWPFERPARYRVVNIETLSPRLVSPTRYQIPIYGSQVKIVPATLPDSGKLLLRRKLSRDRYAFYLAWMDLPNMHELTHYRRPPGMSAESILLLKLYAGRKIGEQDHRVDQTEVYFDSHGHIYHRELSGLGVFEEGRWMALEKPRERVSWEAAGLLWVNSDPAGAELWIDGVSTREVTPKTFTSLKPGLHELRIHKHGYSVWGQKFFLYPGQRKRIQAQLESFTLKRRDEAAESGKKTHSRSRSFLDAAQSSGGGSGSWDPYAQIEAETSRGAKENETSLEHPGGLESDRWNEQQEMGHAGAVNRPEADAFSGKQNGHPSGPHSSETSLLQALTDFTSNGLGPEAEKQTRPGSPEKTRQRGASHQKKNPFQKALNSRLTETVLVPGGEFWMGSEKGEKQESPRHRVRVSDFRLHMHEVTQARFQEVMGYNPSGFPASEGPVENVDWQEAKEFCQKVGGRLPTEAEWEYAARAGSMTDFPWGNEKLSAQHAWYVHNSQGRTHPVGGKKANAFGIHDLGGNVWEWVYDWYGDYPASAQDNPFGPPNGELKVVRGGSALFNSSVLRSSYRSKEAPTRKFHFIGFRCRFPP